MSELNNSYRFRNTPTRNAGDGAYDKYFQNGAKIKQEYEASVKKALFNSTLALNDDCVSFKNVLIKQSATKKPAAKQQDCDYEEEEDFSETMSINSDFSIMTANRTISRLKKESGGGAKTPTANKKKSSIVRRNTISISTTTPTMQKRVFSKIDQSSLSAYEKARIKLHVANTPDCLPCRDKQFSDIFNFIETNLKNLTGGCMYVCGVPGTGKTLTTRQVVLCLQDAMKDRAVPNFKFIEVNAFQVTEPHQIYKLIYKELTDENVSAEHAVMLLEKKFEQKNSEPIVLLVDELDMLCTKKQDVLYNLFDWPYKKNSKWIVIAIANAMNLPEQVMSKISSRLGLTRLNFQPYTHHELEEIVKLRLAELEIFDNDAVVFAARKVAAVSGDARRALEICRRSTELAERDFQEHLKNGQAKVQYNKATTVNISHVDQAIKQMFSSAKITALANASKMERFFMKSIMILYQKSGLEETTLNKIFEQHNFLCRADGMPPLNRTQLLNICCSLASSKMILLEPSRNIYLQRVRCNMSVDDIDYVLNNHN